MSQQIEYLDPPLSTDNSDREKIKTFIFNPDVTFVTLEDLPGLFKLTTRAEGKKHRSRIGGLPAFESVAPFNVEIDDSEVEFIKGTLFGAEPKKAAVIREVYNNH